MTDERVKLVCRECGSDLGKAHEKTCAHWKHTDWVIDRQCRAVPVVPVVVDDSAVRNIVFRHVKEATIEHNGEQYYRRKEVIHAAREIAGLNPKTGEKMVQPYSPYKDGKFVP